MEPGQGRPPNPEQGAAFPSSTEQIGHGGTYSFFQKWRILFEQFVTLS